MNTPLAIAIIALLFSGCSVRVQQNRVCKEKIKQTKALLSELVPQDTLDGAVCMLRPMERELPLAVKESGDCFKGLICEDFLQDMQGFKYFENPAKNLRYYIMDIRQCYADSVRQGMMYFTIYVDAQGLVENIKYIPINDGRYMNPPENSHGRHMQHKLD
jgi:hypothetical protein